MAQPIVFTIEKAVLIAVGAQPGNQAHNYAVFQCDACPTLQVGATVTTAGCITSAFNIAGAIVAQIGVFPVLNSADVNGGSALWTGFSVIVNNAPIAIEIETTVPTDGAEGSPLGSATVTVTQ